jgi:outer membrane protein TolC
MLRMRIPFVLLVLSWCSAARAAETRRLSLAEAVALAARNNPVLAQFDFALAEARARVVQASGREDVLFEVEASYRRQPAPGELALAFERQDLTFVEARLTRLLPTGGTIGVAANNGFSHVVGAVDSATGMRFDVDTHTPSLALIVTQPLLRGIGPSVARQQLHRARAGRQVATLRREAAAADILRDVVAAYWELAYATEEVRIRRDSLDRAQKQLEEVKAQVNAGRKPRAALAEVDASVAGREEDLLRAEMALTERSLDMRRLLGLEIGPGQIDLAAAEAPQVDARDPDLQAAVGRALDRNQALLATREEQRSVEVDLDVARNALLPTLDLSFSAGPVGRSDDFGTAFSELREFSTFNTTAAVLFSTPIGWNDPIGSRDAAQAALRRARAVEAAERARVARDAVASARGVQLARGRMTALERGGAAAETNLEGERARYRAGLTTNFEVLRRQEELALAQLRLARSRTDWLRGQATLEALTGEILGRYGVK